MTAIISTCNQPPYTMANICNSLNEQKPPTPTLGNVGFVFLNFLPALWGRWYL